MVKVYAGNQGTAASHDSLEASTAIKRNALDFMGLENLE